MRARVALALACLAACGDATEAHAVPPSTRMGPKVVHARPGGHSMRMVRPAAASAASGFDFDLTAATLPSGITPVRSQSTTVYLQTGAATVTSVSGTGADIAEDRGDGLGMMRWSLRDVTNDLGSSHSDFAAAGYTLVGGLTRTASSATGPDGVASSATKLSDASGAATGYLQYLGTVDGAGAVNVNSIWVKDDAGDLPSLNPSAALYSYNGHIGLVSQNSADIPNGTTWRRFVGNWPTSNQFAYTVYFGGDAPTVQPSADITLNVGATGSIMVWGASSYHAVAGDAYDAPLAAGSLGNLSWQVGAAGVAAFYAGSDLHVELETVSDGAFTQDGGVAQSWWLWSAATPSGSHGMTWNHSSATVQLVINGSATNVMALTAPPGSRLRFEAWNIGGVSGTRGGYVWLNGCRGITSPTVGLALTAPTDAWLGSNLGADNWTPLRHRRFRKTTRSLDLVEGVILGDSLLSEYPGAHSMMGTNVYTNGEATTRDGMVSYAFPGETVGQQTSRWTTSGQRGNSAVKWVAILVGINDISTGRTSAQTITDLNTLTADIRAQNATAKIVLMSLLPTASTLTAQQKTYFDEVNEAIAGNGGTPVTNVDYRIGLWTTLAHNSVGDSTSNLIGSCDPLADGRHQCESGTDTIAAALRAVLVANGLL